VASEPAAPSDAKPVARQSAAPQAAAKPAAQPVEETEFVRF
jgi:hypothetical protein